MHALDFHRRFPRPWPLPPEERMEAMDTVMQQWTAQDAPAAQKWVETFAGASGGTPGQ
ncbi:MAG: hypothetical protein JWM59_3596 [Verrucomicrobiales bacterium]|nr:hypothetical protein [Verrucomicrobiales bacterium]